MCSSNSLLFLLLTQVVLFVKGVDFHHHTHLEYCGIPEKRDSDPDTCKEYTCLYNFHTDICRTEETSQLPFCAMSSEDQANLAGGDQHGGSNDDEVVSEYFANKENVNSDGDTVGPAAEKVNSNVDTDLTVEKPDDAVHVDQKENICKEECPKEMATELNDSLPEKLENPELETNMIVQTNSLNKELQTPETVNFEAKKIFDTEQSLEKINSNVDNADHTVENPDDTVHGDQIENIYEEECPKEMATELNDSLPEALEDPELETNMIVETNSSVDEVLIPAAVDFEAKTSFDTEQSLEKVKSNVDNADHTVEKPDDAGDQIENIYEEECPKEMATELNDSLPETGAPKNPELETNMSMQTNSLDEEILIPAKPSFDTEQSLDTEAETLNIEGLETSEGQINYTPGDFRSSESGSDMERDTYEDNMSANADNEDVDEFSASSSKTSGWKVWNKKGQKNETKNKSEKSKLVKRPSDRDTENYRNGYPGQEDDKDLNDNIRFYKGEIASSPDGAFIDDIHKHWKGNYKLLERHHGYIQWLFPIRESGMNWQAQPLQLHEAIAIKEDPKARKRVLESYKLMLDFYGMQLVNEKTGELKRSKNWKDCFDNLNWSSHNFLRITRIMKCLGELGYEHLKKNFIKFVLVEALEHHTLEKTVDSCRDYWIGTLKCDQDREELYDYIDSHESKNIW